MNSKYYIKNNLNELIEFQGEIVCTFETEDNLKYMVYTYYDKDEQGRIILHGSTINNDNILKPISSDELYLINDSIQLLKENFENGYKIAGVKDE